MLKPNIKYRVTLTEEEREILKNLMTLPALKGGVSSLDRKFIILAGSIPNSSL